MRVGISALLSRPLKNSSVGEVPRLSQKLPKEQSLGASDDPLLEPNGVRPSSVKLHDCAPIVSV